MRRLVFRSFLLAIMSVGIFAAPHAVAEQKIPGSCDLLKNTNCHCFSPQGLIYCTTMP